MKIILQNANIVNEGKISKNDLLINDDIIEKISNKITPIGNKPPLIRQAGFGPENLALVRGWGYFDPRFSGFWDFGPPKT